MYLPQEQVYRFGNVEIDLTRGVVVRDGEERHLRQQAFQVLVYLLERGDRLVGKDELFEAVWKDTAVTDDVLVQCITEIRRVIGDHPHRPRFIKTVPKAGYRFIGEVDRGSNGAYTEEITRVEFEIEEDAEDRVLPPSQVRYLTAATRPVRRYILAAIAASACAITALIYFGRPFASQTTDVRLPRIDGRQSLVVMPFENRSNSTELDWLRHGLADMLIAGLSRSEKLTILGRGQLDALLDRFSSRTEPVSLDIAKEIARHTQAEYFVTGSFAKLGESVRLDVSLHEAGNGNVSSVETLTVERAEDLLTQIDLLSLKISNRLNAAPGERPDIAQVMTNNLEAYRLYSLGVEKAHGLQNKEAVELLERAIALDPEFAMAHARIGYAYTVMWGQNEKGKPYLEKAFQLSSRLTEKDRMNIGAWYAVAHLDFPRAIDSYRQIIDRFPFETEAYWRLGRLLAGEEQNEEALDVLRQGLIIDPDAKDLHNMLGTILSTRGKHAEAIAAHQRYVELAPREPNAYDSLGLSYQWSGDHKKAIENYDHALALDPQFEIALVHLANTRVRLGQYGVAIDLLHRYVASAPSTNEKARGFDYLANIYFRKGDLKAAEKYGVDASRIRPDLAWNLYRVAHKRGARQRAKVLSQRVLSSPLGNDRGMRRAERFQSYYRGMIALDNGETEAAIAHFRQVLVHSPPVWNDLDFEDCLANAFLRLGRFDEAIAEYERILQLSPNYPLAHYSLGEAYQAKGLTDQALSSYRTFLEVWNDADPDIPEVVMARKFVGS